MSIYGNTLHGNANANAYAYGYGNGNVNAYGNGYGNGYGYGNAYVNAYGNGLGPAENVILQSGGLPGVETSLRYFGRNVAAMAVRGWPGALGLGTYGEGVYGFNTPTSFALADQAALSYVNATLR